MIPACSLRLIPVGAGVVPKVDFGGQISTDVCCFGSILSFTRSRQSRLTGMANRSTVFIRTLAEG